MIKKQFLKELLLSGTQTKGAATNKKADVIKIQSWLNLYAIANPASGTATAIDGDFGASTETAVKNFQKANKLPQTGVVDASLFSLLTFPLDNAFKKTVKGNGLRELIVNTAHQHLANRAFELTVNGQSNSGPWVRSYMDGNEGDPWFWCMGFVQTIIDQAASQLGKDFKTLMPLTYSCDTIGTYGISKNCLLKNAVIHVNPSLVQPGDIFLVRKSDNDWFHTGLVTAIKGTTFETIEGNTNTDGSHNGNGVYKRTRNFALQKLDVFSVQGLV